MAAIGRPRKLNETHRREVLALLATGGGLGLAARYVGCSRQTIRREAERDEEFGRQLREAQLSASLQPLNTLQGAAKTNWRAAAWLLERAHPEKFGPGRMVDTMPAYYEEKFNDLADILIDEITDEATRRRIQERLGIIAEDGVDLERF